MKKTTIFFTQTLCLLTAGALAAPPDAAALKQVVAKRSAETPVVVGADGWIYLPAELAHLAAGKFWGSEAAAVSKATKPENADPLPAILDFKEQLAAAGVELILVPVPAKAMVYPEPLFGGVPADTPPERLDPFHEEFYEELENNGVTVVDLLPEFLAARSQEQVYCRTDTHWSGKATELAAKKIAALIKEKGVEGETAVETMAEEKKIEIKGDLARMQNPASPKSESLTLRFIADDSGAAVPPDPASPVLLLGDSHTLVFQAGGDMLASGAGLADQLAHDLGYPVDLIGVRGSGATPARINLMRKIRADDNYLSNKKILVWCFSVREFTESTGWSKVPLGKP